MVRHHADDRQGHPAGPVSTCSSHAPPPPGPAARRRRAGKPAKPADPGYGRPSCEPRTANVAPSLPVRSDAGRRPRRRPRTTAARRPAAPDRGAAHHTEPLRGPARPGQRGSAADTGGLSVRTPGHWMSARPVGRTSSRWDRGRGQGNDRPSQRPDILATGDHPLGGPTLPGSRRLGALGHPGRSRHLRRVLTAAATGQLPGTARHKARLGALLSSDDFGSSVERTAKLHPLWQACEGGECWLLDRRCAEV
jgi:hypothetical protein